MANDCSMPLFVEPPITFTVNKPFYYVLLNYDGFLLFKGSQQKF